MEFKMNIAETMRNSLKKLKAGLDDIEFPEIRPECEEEWDENYAVVQNVYYDYPESDYFDHDRFRQDYENMVKEIFPNCKVKFYWQSQEIEVSKW
jgi:tRNA(Ile)-lysidine synthase TilS/MesJ